MQKEKNRLSIPLAIFGSISILLISMFFYNIYISDEIEELSDNNIEQLVSNNAEAFKLKLESDINLIESSAALLPVWDFLRYINFDSSNYQYLSRAFDYMLVINPYGYAVGSDNSIGDLADYEYFQKALKGETVISDPFISTFTQRHGIAIATPMIAHGETRGVLAGHIYLDSLDEMYGAQIAGIQANIIVDSQGTIISNSVKNSIHPPLSNLFVNIEKYLPTDQDTFNALKKDINSNHAGKETLYFNEQTYTLIYKPIGIKDWMIVSIIPENIVQATTSNIVIVSAIVSVVIMLIVSIFGMMINASQRNTLKKIAEIAYISQLTGINTLVKFKLDAKDFVTTNTAKNFLLIKFDIENFRLVNESLGTKEGDRVLKNMAQAIACSKKSVSCTTAHLHTDEFLVLLAYTNEDVENWRDDYSAELFKRLGDDFNYNLRVVAGFYYMDEESAKDITTAIERVNIAHRHAKETKSLLSVYSNEFLTTAIKIKEIENVMEEALQKDEFLIYLQPELDLHTGKLMGAEALVRWKSPSGFMQPDEFIPIFEKNGFILKLDMYMFEQACKYLQAWIMEGRTPFIISINFSRKHLYSLDFVANLVNISKQYDISPKYLGIEITESSMLSNEGDLISLIRHLQDTGFNVLMDDFGSGYSSLGLLKNIPVDVLKLDKSFLTNIDERERSFAVVSSAIQLAKRINIKTLAEGVETLEHLQILQQMGCDVIQGYYYAKPMPATEFKTFYDSEKSTMPINAVKTHRVFTFAEPL